MGETKDVRHGSYGSGLSLRRVQMSIVVAMDARRII
jgi:hypothetical protein